MKKALKNILLVFSLLTILGMVSYALFSDEAKRENTENTENPVKEIMETREYAAIFAVKSFAKRAVLPHMKDPNSYYDGSGVEGFISQPIDSLNYEVEGWYEGKNSFNGTIRSYYTATVAFTGLESNQKYIIEDFRVKQ